MLIGIDMLGVQSPQGGDRQTGRFGRQLVKSLLASDSVHRFILYTHESLPTHRLPLSRNASRVSLAPIPGGSNRLRPTIQRVIDQNPDGLDWLLLLDPFEPNYGAIPPESSLNELKVASLLLDLAPSLADDRRLVPLRRHDAILAVSEATANLCRRRLGSASSRVSTIKVACDSSDAGDRSEEPLTRVSAEELGRLGITGPFLFAHLVGGSERANLSGIIDAYHRLPFELRRRHQLVIAGHVSDPWAVVAYLYDRGCAEGLVLVGEVDEATLRMLYRRSSVFLSPSIEEGSGLTLVEALSCGAAVIAGCSGAQPEIVGDAGLLVDPANPAAIAEQLTRLLSDADLDFELRSRAVERASDFGWEPVVQAVFATFQAEEAPATARRYRVDGPHAARPRIAVFADQAPIAWPETYHIDLYLEPETASLADGISSEFGAFDARQFDRNDGILRYHAVVYRLGGVEDIEAKLGRLRSRPGLVFISDDSGLGVTEFSGGAMSSPPHPNPPPQGGRESDASVRSSSSGPLPPCGGGLGWGGRVAPPETAVKPSGFDRLTLDPEGVSALRILGQLRELFLTSSRLVVSSAEHLEQIQIGLPEFASQVVELSSDSSKLGMLLTAEIERCAAELPKGSGRRTRRPGSTPHSTRSSSLDDEVASRSR